MVENIKSVFNKILKPFFLILKLSLKDFLRLRNNGYSSDFHLKKGIDWLISAQKITKDGGISAGYSLLFGWRSSFPETSGYIIPTLFDYYNISKNKIYVEICKKITDWECSIQLENGGFQGDLINKKKKVIIFNTGQIVLGLVRAFKELKIQKYLDCAITAGDLLVSIQNKNGNWMKNCFNNIPHTYNVRVAWALLELYRVTFEKKYQEAAIKNLNWGLTQRNRNHWYSNNSFKANKNPLLHSISYSMRGFLEAGIILENEKYKDAAYNTAIKLMQFYEKNCFLPARFNSNWESNDYYRCLTGIAQLSIIWLKMYQIYKQKRFLFNSLKLNKFLKVTQILDKRFKEIDGAIKGSDPIWGKYNIFSFPNWATKFFCDALILEKKILSTSEFVDIKRI